MNIIFREQLHKNIIIEQHLFVTFDAVQKRCASEVNINKRVVNITKQSFNHN